MKSLTLQKRDDLWDSTLMQNRWGSGIGEQSQSGEPERRNSRAIEIEEMKMDLYAYAVGSTVIVVGSLLGAIVSLEAWSIRKQASEALGSNGEVRRTSLGHDHAVARYLDRNPNS